jgi:hypothetical protein
MIDRLMEACMARVTVTPVIGVPRSSRLHSLAGCHALTEKAVTKAFQSREDMGHAIAEALYDIAVMQNASRLTKAISAIDDMSYVVKFDLS